MCNIVNINEENEKKIESPATVLAKKVLVELKEVYGKSIEYMGSELFLKECAELKDEFLTRKITVDNAVDRLGRFLVEKNMAPSTGYSKVLYKYLDQQKALGEKEYANFVTKLSIANQELTIKWSEIFNIAISENILPQLHMAQAGPGNIIT